MIFDSRACHLGEGPLWHPLREQLFWFDITGRRLLTRKDDVAQEWHFAEMVSAAGWVGEDELLVASETGLFRFDLARGRRRMVAAIDADDPSTRSNDGRADPQGGFWIGTMGKRPEQGQGAIYRFHRGDLRRIFPGITIPNGIAFAPDGRTATFADSPTRKVWRVALDAEGWPLGQPEVFLSLPPDGPEPDGAVFDAEGRYWLAEWGGFRVSCWAPDGARLAEIAFPAPHTSCPAFGGTTLYCTSALQDMTDTDRAAWPEAGGTFAAMNVAQGQSEHRVIL